MNIYTQTFNGNKDVGNYLPSNYETDDMNYKWYYKARHMFDPCTKKIKVVYDGDKIGISSDGKFMMHDNMMCKLELWKKHEEVKSTNEKYLYLMYKFNGGIDLIMRRNESLLHFKYLKVGGNKTVFVSIGFNNANYYDKTK